MAPAQEARSLAQTLARLRDARELREPISVRITPEQRQQLQRLHAHTGGKRSELLRELFTQGLKACAEAIGLDLDSAEQAEAPEPAATPCPHADEAS